MQRKNNRIYSILHMVLHQVLPILAPHEQPLLWSLDLVTWPFTVLTLHFAAVTLAIVALYVVFLDIQPPSDKPALTVTAP